jgi:hypothetical protein
MTVSLTDVSTAFSGAPNPVATAPHSLTELYGTLFSTGTSAQTTGEISLSLFDGKFQPAEASGTWTHIALPHYGENYGSGYVRAIQPFWKIVLRVYVNGVAETSLYSHGTEVTTYATRPSTIYMEEGFLTPTQYSILPGSSGQFGYINVGVVDLNGAWVKTANQTS